MNALTTEFIVILDWLRQVKQGLFFLHIQGSSFHCVHFVKNTITPSLCYEVAWTFSMLLTDALSTTKHFILFFKILTVSGQKYKSVNIYVDFLPISTRPHWILQFFVRFSSGKKYFLKLPKSQNLRLLKKMSFLFGYFVFKNSIICPMFGMIWKINI